MKTKLTKQVEDNLYNFTHEKIVYGCFEVTLGLGMANDHREIVDYLTYDHNSVFRCYEIKTSYADYKSHARLSWWGDYNYLVTTESVWQEIKQHDADVWGIGTIVMDENGNFRSVSRASKHQVTVGEKVTMLESMVRSMDRELKKYYQIKAY